MICRTMPSCLILFGNEIDIVRQTGYNSDKSKMEVPQMADFITVAEAARNWGISERRILVFCKESRISVASKKGCVI